MSNEFEGTVARIDPHTNQVVRRIAIGHRPQGLATVGGTVLVTLRESGARHRGGTLTVRASRSTDSIDTAVAYDSLSWPILRMTNDGLVAFNQASGLQGTQLVPNLAVSLPAPTDGGKIYRFQLRRDILYSNGRAVSARDFVRAFQRVFTLNPAASGYYAGIVGGRDVLRSRKRVTSLAGSSRTTTQGR